MLPAPSSQTQGGSRSLTRRSAPVLTTRTLSGFPNDRRRYPTVQCTAPHIRDRLRGLFVTRAALAAVSTTSGRLSPCDRRHAARAPLTSGMLCWPDPAILSPPFSPDELYRQSCGRPDDSPRLLWHAAHARTPVANVERQFMVRRCRIVKKA
jgi:hypothetical protein